MAIVPRFFFWDALPAEAVSPHLVIKTCLCLGVNNYTTPTVYWDSAINPPVSTITVLTFMQGLSSGAITPANQGKFGLLIPLAFTGAFQAEMCYYDGTNPPIQVDATNHLANQIEGRGWGWVVGTGAFWYTDNIGRSNWWAIGSIINLSTGRASSMRVYKNSTLTSGGTGVDTSNEPVPATPSTPTLWAAMRYDGHSNYIRVAAVLNSTPNVFDLMEFNLDSQTWASPHDGFNGTGFESFCDVLELGNGDVAVFYFASLGRAHEDIACVILHLGVWSSPINVTANLPSSNDFAYNQSILDGNGTTIHTFFDDLLFPGSHVLPYYQPIDTTTNTLGSIHAFPQDLLADEDQNSFGHGVIDNLGDLLMPIDHDTSGTGAYGCTGVWRGSPSATPTWTLELIDAANINQKPSCTFIAWDNSPNPGSPFGPPILFPKYVKRHNAPGNN